MGPPIEAYYTAFPQDPKICPVQALRCYEKQSEGFRPKHNKTKGSPLFISVRKPYKPVKAATIGHWLKTVMDSAGIDTNIFSAHSTRGAATSKARAGGGSTADILRAANWTSASTFSCFYHRPVERGQFGYEVLTRRDTPQTLVSFERYHVVN